MSDPLETHLRDLLAARAAEIPGAAHALVRGADYYSRARRRRIVFATSGVAGVAGPVAAAAVLIALGTNTATQTAYAGWTPSPKHASAAQLAQAEDACQGQTPALPASSGAPPTPWQRVLTDTRGRSTMIIFQNATHWWSCFPEAGAIGGGDGTVPPAPPRGQIEVVGWANAPADPYTVIYGRVGAGVTGVALLRDDGTRVQSTVNGGWFAAWWPGPERANTVELASGEHTQTQPLKLYWG